MMIAGAVDFSAQAVRVGRSGPWSRCTVNLAQDHPQLAREESLKIMSS